MAISRPFRANIGGRLGSAQQARYKGCFRHSGRARSSSPRTLNPFVESSILSAPTSTTRDFQAKFDV
jgi:hypothetical protein